MSDKPANPRPSVLGRRQIAGLVLEVTLFASLAGCDSSQSAATSPLTRGPIASEGNAIAAKAPRTRKPAVAQERSPFQFAEVAKEAGIDFVHVSGTTAEDKYFPTANGSGVAILDYDGDGLMDLYFASNCFLPVGSRPEGRNRLYKNLGGLKFRDVTEESGLDFHGFCHGIIAGDFDGDGDSDIFLATYHQNTLFANNGDGTFRDVGRQAGVAPAGFHGRIVTDGTTDKPLVVDAVAGLKWRLDGGEPTDDLTLKVKKGQKLTFRQADPDAPRGLEILADPGMIVLAGDAEPDRKLGAVLRELGAGPSRLYKSAPPAPAGSEPVILAEFEVVGEPTKPIGFECSEHRTAWSSGGAALDYDQDGDLDFYVTNYGFWTIEDHGSQFCGNREKNVRQYCSPREVTTVRHILYRNDGVADGVPQFTDVTDEAGVNRSDGHGFGVVAADLDGDDKLDLYVANDQNPAFLYLNNGDGTFRDATESSCAGYDEKGATQSGMGVDAADVDGDGRPELFRTNFANEYNTLYYNIGKGTFYDQTAAFGLAADAMTWVGWGCALADFDNDGWPDVFVTNGHVDDNYRLLGINDVPYAEPPLIHRNVALGDGPDAARRFQLATFGAGLYFESSHVGRGAAFGDLDNDGDIDIVINHKDGPPALLRNDTPADRNHWLRLKLRGTTSHREAIGTKVAVIAGGRTIDRQLKGGCSLESTNDPRLLIGVGPASKLETVLVKWPSGRETVLKDVTTDQELELIEPVE